MYKEGVALKRKIVFPLFRTINVCGEREGETEKEKDKRLSDQIIWHILCSTWSDVSPEITSESRGNAALVSMLHC